MLQHTNGSHLEEGINTYLNNNNIGPLVQETIISHTRNALINNHHPRHQLSLATLRSVTARHKKGTNTPEADKDREKISFDYTLEAIQKMQEIGLSQETISAIVDSLYDLSLNYHNSKEKIRSLGKVTFIKEDGKEKRKHETDIEKNLQNNIGWTCGPIAMAYNDILDQNRISSLIRTDLLNKYGEPKLRKENFKIGRIRMEIIRGYDRTYFTTETSFHIFWRLTIGENEFILDPSFGEINIISQSGYKIGNVVSQETLKKHKENMNEFIHSTRVLGGFKTKETVITQSTKWERDKKINGGHIFIGLLDGTKYCCEIGFIKASSTGKAYPCIGIENDNKNIIIGILDDNKELLLKKDNIPGRLKEKMKEHLLILDSITEYS